MITETELKHMAKAATIGESKVPVVEYKTPAAIAIPITLYKNDVIKIKGNEYIIC